MVTEICSAEALLCGIGAVFVVCKSKNHITRCGEKIWKSHRAEDDKSLKNNIIG